VSSDVIREQSTLLGSLKGRDRMISGSSFSRPLGGAFNSELQVLRVHNRLPITPAYQAVVFHSDNDLDRQSEVAGQFLGCRDPIVPIEETIGLVSDLVKEGKGRCVILSEAPAPALRRGHAVDPISALEIEYFIFSQGTCSALPQLAETCDHSPESASFRHCCPDFSIAFDWNLTCLHHLSRR
jgi:hypothetical protein